MNHWGVFIGTRPECIKLAPVAKALLERNDVKTSLITTGQHREMLDPIAKLFNLNFDLNMQLMTENQSLAQLSASILDSSSRLFEEMDFSGVIVQGDTTTAAMVALAAFYKKIPVAHVEAGLRSHNPLSPFPEEMNRQMIGRIADFHFVPTLGAKENLLREGVSEERIFHVGNTVIDAQNLVLNELKSDPGKVSQSIQSLVDSTEKRVLVTCHRRENHGEPLQRICGAIKALATENSDVHFVYPVHLNPNVKNVVESDLAGVENIHLLPPVEYHDLLFLLDNSMFALSDSGGIQEESVGQSKHVIILREETERPEVIQCGLGQLVGSSTEKICKAFNELVNADPVSADFENPFGRGDAGLQIVEKLASAKPAKNR